MSLHARDSGAISLTMTLIILVALSLVTLVGSRVALVQQRMAANNARADTAFAAADAGLQAAQQYLIANKAQITATGSGGWMNSSSSVKWQDCSAGSTTPPCGDGDNNLYGSGWQYYGPIPNLPALPGEYQYQAWYLSNTLSTDPQYTPWTGCLNLGLTALLPPVTGTLIGSINSLLNLLVPGLGLPVNTCLPVNFSQLPTVAPPSKINPTIDAVSQASSNSDSAGAVARVSAKLQRTSIFAHAPVSGLMVNGNGDLAGDIRIWGNPRPPTVAPADFSVLQLHDVLGLNITSLLGTQISNDLINLMPLLNLTAQQILALNANATFPLSIWADDSITLEADTSGDNTALLSGARTCLPQWGGSSDSACTPLSISVQSLVPPKICVLGICLPALGLPALLPPLQLHLADIQDPSNLVSTVGNLLGSNPPPPFPSDLFDFTFGVPNADYAKLKAGATVLNSCNSLNNDSVGLYWIDGSCTLNGNIGMPGAPAVIVITGNLSFTSNAMANAVVYMYGGGNKIVTGAHTPNRPTLRGALLVDGNLAMGSKVNIVYDQNNIRAAGFLAGSFAPLAGGWDDQWSAP